MNCVLMNCVELLKIELITCIKIDLALNYLQSLICHKTQITKPKFNLTKSFIGYLVFCPISPRKFVYKSSSFELCETDSHLFVAASHQTRLDTRSKVRRPIKVGIKGGEGREQAETRTLLVCAAHLLT